MNYYIIEHEQGYTPSAMTLLDCDSISTLDSLNNKLKLSVTDASPQSVVQKEKSDLPSDKSKSLQNSAKQFRKATQESTSLTSEHNVVPQKYDSLSSPKDKEILTYFVNIDGTPEDAIKTFNTVHELEHESNHATDKMKSSDDHQRTAGHKSQVKIILYFNYNVI